LIEAETRVVIGSAPTIKMTKSWRRVGVLAGLGMGTLLAEAAYAVFRRVPELEGFAANGCVGPVDGDPLLMVVLGDSSCTGPGLNEAAEIWFHLIASKLAQRGHRVTIESFAVGGATSASALQTQLPAAEKLNPDLTLIAIGTNDVTHQVPLSTLARNLDAIVGRMSRVSDLVVVAGIGDLGTVPRLLPPLRQLATRRGRRGDAVQTTVAGRHGAVKADLWGAVAAAFRSDPSIFSVDLFHPAAPGHRVWADAAWEALEPRLASSRKVVDGRFQLASPR
jgi:lysophospholipase L1-like esterase